VERSLTLIDPVPLRAEVIHGFGRGSKVLGFPTANMRIRWGDDQGITKTDEELAVLDFAGDIQTGIYAAYAMVEDGPDRGVYKVAMSVGWNPTFKDLKYKTIEPWILHDFEEDFYGCHLKLLVVAYIRPEENFFKDGVAYEDAMATLIAEIQADGDYCATHLDSDVLKPLASHAFFTPMPALPVLDAAALAAAQSSDDPMVQNLRTACLEQGFFIIENHQIPHEMLDRCFEVASTFFAQSDEMKLEHASSAARNYRGFTPMGGGHNCSAKSVRPEIKETFYFGGSADWDDQSLVPEIEDFDELSKQFHASMLELSRVTLRAMSLALGLSSDYFESKACRNPAAKVLFTSYPPVDTGGMSCGAHTDCGFLTMLCSSGGRGLAVQRMDGTWISVASSRYKFVCNLGDLATKWTNGLFRSTPHRVLNDSHESVRQSLIFFNNLDADAIIEVVPTCLKDGEEASQDQSAMTCGEYVASKLGKMRDNYEGDDQEEALDEPVWSEVVEAAPFSSAP